jgi:hypothetical protein
MCNRDTRRESDDLTPRGARWNSVLGFLVASFLPVVCAIQACGGETSHDSAVAAVAGANGVAGAAAPEGGMESGGTGAPEGGLSGGSRSTGGSAAGGTGGTMVCAAGQDLCGSACTSLQTDPGNCGACGYACSSVGDACIAGQCVTLCNYPPGFVYCDTSCVDLKNDPRNCGECGKACAWSATCREGLCLCPEGWVVCSGFCADVQRDPQNCGTCGRSCGGGMCVAGGCNL